ncbi:unnamed protein product [Paramecium primaurelia]|uniref:Uncharacterized protein n=1 Tax=Paramecium primaurelia TaxID=5886 RepID=A0A8S1QBD1_PARPR|nr:unnamed protein product [Paramecium primaurelia]
MVHNNQDGCQIICYGQYYLGLKNSTFVYKCRENNNESFQNILINQQIQKCEYNEQGLKKGRWIEIDKNFSKLLIYFIFDLESAKLFKMVNIIMVKSAINGIYSIEKIKVRNGELQEEENMIVKEKNKVNGLFWRKKQSIVIQIKI